MVSRSYTVAVQMMHRTGRWSQSFYNADSVNYCLFLFRVVGVLEHIISAVIKMRSLELNILHVFCLFFGLNMCKICIESQGNWMFLSPLNANSNLPTCTSNIVVLSPNSLIGCWFVFSCFLFMWHLSKAILHFTAIQTTCFIRDKNTFCKAFMSSLMYVLV